MKLAKVFAANEGAFTRNAKQNSIFSPKLLYFFLSINSCTVSDYINLNILIKFIILMILLFLVLKSELLNRNEL